MHVRICESGQNALPLKIDARRDGSVHLRQVIACKKDAAAIFHHKPEDPVLILAGDKISILKYLHEGSPRCQFVPRFRM
jgi:hypothetical protein